MNDRVREIKKIRNEITEIAILMAVELSFLITIAFFALEAFPARTIGYAIFFGACMGLCFGGGMVGLIRHFERRDKKSIAGPTIDEENVKLPIEIITDLRIYFRLSIFPIFLGLIGFILILKLDQPLWTLVIAMNLETLFFIDAQALPILLRRLKQARMKEKACDANVDGKTSNPHER